MVVSGSTLDFILTGGPYWAYYFPLASFDRSHDKSATILMFWDILEVNVES